MKDKYGITVIVVILSVSWGLAIYVAFTYFRKLNFLVNLSNSNSGSINIFINSLVAIGTILLAMATFMTLYISVKQVDKKNEQLLNQYNEDHLKNIKEILNILRDLIEKKYSNDTFFEINEGMLFDENDLQRRINSERHSYDQESIYDDNYKIILNNKIYKDLYNHKITKDIPDKFEDLLKSIKNNTPEYIKGLINIFQEIRKTDEYKNLEIKIDNKYNVPSIFPYGKSLKKTSYILVLAILLEYQNIKYNFQNYFDSIKQVNGYENIEKIAEILRNKAETTVKYREEIKKKLDDLLKNIKNALEYDNLLDECDYLKMKREIIVMK